MRPLVAIVALLLPAVHVTALAAEPKTEEEKALYSLGVALSQNVINFNLTEAELEMVKQGLTDGILQRNLKVDPKAYVPQLRELQTKRMAAAAATEKKAGQNYVAKAAAEQGATKTASGLVIKTLKEGTGPYPKQ
ncbi:MAG TPA: FKBP-type peptidyl-prolyl cis-trans isomerase N-terminal domain-containing protein, partial [Steroidobacter sp.]|nr:FKBP-type peptidyl-prolyl cis-trans isomerase N-terminal domain-containing protein [Steroidobacter sp.]